ncbi:MAG: iron ABC transporter permease [Candidatus Tectomicrobia bacterium]|uniref:Iron ABC transporter permease n=1 Tax=Tectimicrobiota bacterium TaxID=2528274 RepID=A0A932M1A6_UNCTE|nr:iron ABC transporter permease [Candidatus Tectomicrobia bacterium]
MEERPQLLARHTRDRWLGIALVIGVAAITVLPIAFVVVNSFNVAQPSQPWTFGLSGWSDAIFGSSRTLSSLTYSLILSVRAPLAVAIAFLISWLLIRAQIPGRSVIELALWTAFFLPALPITLGWVLLLDPNSGLINIFLKKLPWQLGPLNIQSVVGILWVHMSIATVPVMTMLLAPAFRIMDASMEEVSRTCGAKNWQTLRRITFPLILPASLTAVLAGLIRSLEAFEVEQLLGSRSGIYVYATRIYDLINYQPPQIPQAMALSTLILGVLCLLALLYQRIVSSRNYATVTGRGMSMRPLLTGRWRYAASAALFAYIGIGVVLPVTVLVLGSFMRLFGFFGISHPFTLDHWRRVLESPVFSLAVRNTLVLSLSTSILGLVFYSVLGYVLARSNLTGRKLIGLMTWLPWAIPGMLLGIGLLWLLLSMPVLGLLYGNIGALLLALFIKELPLGVNLSSVAFLQISQELEFSSRVCGASWFRTYRRIMLPLIAPTLVSLFAVTFIGAVRDISTTVLLVTPSSRTLSLLMFEFSAAGNIESAAILGLIVTVLAVGVALVVRRLGLSMSVS